VTLTQVLGNALAATLTVRYYTVSRNTTTCCQNDACHVMTHISEMNCTVLVGLDTFNFKSGLGQGLREIIVFFFLDLKSYQNSP
jgi:hypothetical protein